jgi:sterol desaturase/sphingolipid hydroxylase (fatty acid hydroxylase superfamily)
VAADVQGWTDLPPEVDGRRESDRAEPDARADGANAEQAEVIDALVATLLSLAVLVVCFVPLERAFPARVQRMLRPEIATDGAFFLGQYLVFTTASVAVLGEVAKAYAHGLPNAVDAARSIPLPARLVLAIAAGDVAVYWFHRASHRFDFLWRFHSVHHSSEHLDWMAAHREHPVDGVLTQLCQNAPAILLAAPLGSVAWFAVFRGMWAVFVHSNTRLPLGPLRWILGSPELHHWHHARLDANDVANFANLAPWLDLLFGTHHLPAASRDYAMGDGERRRSKVGLLIRPFLPMRAVEHRPAATVAAME